MAAAASSNPTDGETMPVEVSPRAEVAAKRELFGETVPDPTEGDFNEEGKSRGGDEKAKEDTVHARDASAFPQPKVGEMRTDASPLGPSLDDPWWGNIGTPAEQIKMKMSSQHPMPLRCVLYLSLIKFLTSRSRMLPLKLAHMEPAHPIRETMSFGPVGGVTSGAAKTMS